MFKTKNTLLLSATAAMAALLVACGGGDTPKEDSNTSAKDSSPSEQGVVFHRGNGTAPNSLDPHQANGTWENNIIGDMFLGLFTEDADANSVYGAATSHDVSADGMTHTFKLREGMVWSDGTPVTAHDFVYAWQRILNPNTAAPYSTLLMSFKNAAPITAGEMDPSELGAEAVDDLTLVLHTETPVPFIRTLMTHYTTFPIPKHAVEAHGDAWAKPENIVVNGAYKLAEWRLNSHVKSVKNPMFYDAENVQIDTVYYYPTNDVAAGLKRFRAGELDVNACSQCYPNTEASRINETMPGVIRNELILSTTYIAFNLNKAPLDDIRVRRALALSIDRDTLVKSVLRSGEVPAYSFVPPGISNYVEKAPQLEGAEGTHAERLATAKALLAEAGYDNKNPLKLTVKFRSSGNRKNIMVAMQAMWRSAGIEITLDPKEPKVAYADYRSRNFEIADAGWVADYSDPENYLYLAESTTGKLNYSDYENPEYDALMAKARVTIDLQQRAELLAEAEGILMRDLPIVPFYYSVNLNLVGLHVDNWRDNVLGIQRTRWLSIDESKRVDY